MFAVDISNWSGEITLENVRCWKRNDVTRVIIGTQNEVITRQQIAAITNVGGVELEAYVYLYDNYIAFADQVDEAIRRFYGYPVRRLWLDCEFATSAPPDVVVERIQRAIDACRVAGIPYGIYTGQWWWVPTTNNSTAFAHESLWFANYPTPPPEKNVPQSLRAGFGGWHDGVMRQYRGTTSLCDVNVDYNWYEEEKVVDDCEERVKALTEELYRVTIARNQLKKQNDALRACLSAYQKRCRTLVNGMQALIDADADALRLVASTMKAELIS